MSGRTKHTITITTFKRELKRENHEQYLLFTKRTECIGYDLTDDERSVINTITQYVWCSNILAPVSPVSRFKDESVGHWIARLHRYKLKYPSFEPVKPMVTTLKLAYSHGSCGVPPKYKLFECEPYEDFSRISLNNCTELYGVPKNVF